MSDGTHSTPPNLPGTRPNRTDFASRLRSLGGNRSALIISGLGFAILAGGLLIQIFRAEPSAAEETSGSRNAGTASVSSSKQMARVGDHIITYDILAAETVTRYGKEVLENMINRAVIQQACQKHGIQVTETEVMQEVQQIAQKFKLDTDVWYQMLQAERGLTPMQYQRDIIWPMLALRKLAGDDIAITNADRKRAFERDYGPRVEAKMIMLDNQRRAQEVWAKATTVDPSIGERPDFSRLARENSIEPTSKALGGDIPPIRMHVGSEKIVEEAFKLQVGEISGIIQAGPGRYVILLCEGHTEQIATYKEVRDMIEENLLEEKRQEAVAKVFERLKKEIPVHNFVTNTSSGGVRQTTGTRRFNAGGKVVPADGTARPTSPAANVRSPLTND